MRFKQLTGISNETKFSYGVFCVAQQKEEIKK
ncbi:hypothetical protein BH11BAC4_BH11BAC4_02260 [soil metagenome]